MTLRIGTPFAKRKIAELTTRDADGVSAETASIKLPMKMTQTQL